MGVGCAPLPEISELCSSLQVQVERGEVRADGHLELGLRIEDCMSQPITKQLTADAITIRENDARIPPSHGARQLQPVDQGVPLGVVLLDLSALDTDRELTMLESARNLIHALVPQTRVALYGFDGRSELVPFSTAETDRWSLMRRLDEVPLYTPDGSTNLHGAVARGLEVLDAADRAGALFVFSASPDRAGHMPEEDAKHRVERSPHTVLGLALSADARSAVTALTKDGRVELYPADSTSEHDTRTQAVAKRALERMAQSGPTRYTLDYCSPSRMGSRVLQVEVEAYGVRGEAEFHFSAEHFEGGCSLP